MGSATSLVDLLTTAETYYLPLDSLAAALASSEPDIECLCGQD